MNQKNTILQCLAFILVPIGLYAQPVITLEDYTPEYGSAVTLMIAEYLPAGNAGENQVWDFSDMQGIGSYGLTFSNPAGFFASDRFPEATHVHTLGGGEMTASLFTKYDKNEVQSLGLVDEITNYIDVYNPLQRMYPFPLEYNASFEENWKDTLEADEFSSKISIGSTTTIVDGYGTLISPAGTFENVLRIRKESENLLLTTTQGKKTEFATSQTSYAFIQAGIPVPILLISEHNHEGGSITNAEYYVGGKANTE